MALAPRQSDPTISPSVAIRAAERIAERWSLKRQDLPALLATPPRTVRFWREHTPAKLPADVLERIGHLVGIFDALHRIFGDSIYADRWIHEANAAFANETPATLLLSGSFTALVDVRRYVEAALVV